LPWNLLASLKFHRLTANFFAAQLGEQSLPRLCIIELLALDQRDELFGLYQP